MVEFAGMTAIVVEATDHGLLPMLKPLGIRAKTARVYPETLQLLSDENVDFVIADALLPGLDGPALLKQIGEMRALRVRPGRILTCIGGFPADGALRVLARPFGMAALTEALRAELPENRARSEGADVRIHSLLDRLGIPEHRGRACLADAVWMALNDARLSGQLSRRVYPALALRHDLKAAQAERAVRHCIDVAWKRGSVEEQYRLFGNTIDAQRGKPTVGEMIARVADILRLEESI